MNTGRTVRYLCLFITLLITMTGIVSAQSKKNVKLGKLVSTNEIIIGLVPAEDPNLVLERQKPLSEYLSKILKRPVKTFIATDYTGVVEAMRAGKIHIAWFGPFSHVMAAERANAVPLAVPIKDDGKSTYQSYMSVSSDVAKILGINQVYKGEAGMKEIIKKMENHKKKYTLAFTDPASTSGYAVPRYFIHKAGVKPEDVFKRVTYLGAHDAAQLVVKNKIIDFAFCWDKTYQDMLADGRIDAKSNQLIWMSDEIPESPISYRRDLPADIVAALKKGFEEMPEDLARIQGKTYKGYQVITEKEYEVIHEIKKMLDTL